MRQLCIALAVCALTGCTAVDKTTLPSGRGMGQIFITQESVSEPYDSVGVIQITRRGVLLFGFADPAGTDLAAATRELEPKIRAAGADGAMNVRFEMTQYTLAGRLLGLLFFFAPFPTEVTVTAELVKLKGNAPAPAMPAVAPGGTQL